MEAILSESNIPNMQSHLSTIQQSQMALQNAYKAYTLGINGDGTPQGIVDALGNEQAKNMQIQMDTLNQAEAVASTNLSNAMTYVGLQQQAMGTDYKNAVDSYNTVFANALSVQGILNTQANQNQQNSAAYLSSLSSLITSGSLDPSALPAATKASIATAELTAGWPVGTIENFAKMKPGANIVGSVNSVGANGNQITSLLHQNPDGSISVTNVELPGSPTSLFGVLPGSGGTSGSSTGTNGYTGSTIASSGFTGDTSASLSSVLADPKQAASLFAAMFKAEGGGSQVGSKFNNPLDLKFNANTQAMGATDSGAKAQDGGTFAAFPDQITAEQAYVKLLSSPPYKDMTVDKAMQTWSGYNGSSTSSGGSNGVVQSWVNNIKNGVGTLANVPAGLKNAVSIAYNALPAGSFTPLAGSRFTIEANRIVSNYIAMPAYQLTAGGQLYLGRIQAAMKTPGSVSDQDLLDSLTKLNTGGNAISDAQVSLITNGQSYKDWASVLGNKLGTGGVLSNDQRNQIETLATNIYASYQKAYQPIYNQATALLQGAGIPQTFWTIPDLNNLGANVAASTGPSSGSSVQQQAASAGYDYTAMHNAGWSDADIQAALSSQ